MKNQYCTKQSAEITLTAADCTAPSKNSCNNLAWSLFHGDRQSAADVPLSPWIKVFSLWLV